MRLGSRREENSVNRNMNTHRHHYLFAVAEQYGLLQHVVRDGVEHEAPRRHGSHVEVKQPLYLIQSQYKMLPESLYDKVPQLRRRRVGRAPTITISVIEAGTSSTGITIDRTVGHRGVHGFVVKVTDAASCPFGIQLLLKG